MITKGRVIKGVFVDAASSSGDGAASTVRALGPARGEARRMDGVIVDAYVEADRIREAAKTEAAAIVETARKQASNVSESAADDARKNETAKFAARYLALHAHEEKKADRDLARTTDLAKALAERLVAGALDANPERIADMARRALAEARGARRAKIRAHAEDASALAQKLADLGMPPGAVEVAVDASLTRGSLLLDTELGTLDARIAPQLERLAEALKDVLRDH